MGNRMTRALVSLAMMLTLAPSMATAQTLGSGPEDGDLVHIARAEGPLHGQVVARGRRLLEELPGAGRMLRYNVQFDYGLSSYLSVGLAAAHFEQRTGLLHKSGLGDTHLSLKASFQPYPDRPLRLGLRQVLVLPTGFEEERAGLMPFTTGEYQYAAQALFQYDARVGARRLSAYVDPGVLLPGGDLDAYVTAGLGLEAVGFLPFGISAFGEYAARWSLVSQDPDAEVNAGVGIPLALGVGVEIGARRRLLPDHAVDLETHLGVSFGWPRGAGDLLEVESSPRAMTALLVLPIEAMMPDPHGVAGQLASVIRTRTPHSEGALSVFVRTIPGEHRDALAQVRHYELAIRILAIDDGEVGGFSVPLLLRAPRATTTITAQMELVAPDGYSIVARSVFEGSASRGLGAEIAPSSTSVLTKVTPDEVKSALRDEAARRVAEQIVAEATSVIAAREAL